MIRNLLNPSPLGRAFISACCFLAANASWGLELGEIEVNSSLKERLEARVDILDASGLNSADRQVGFKATTTSEVQVTSRPVLLAGPMRPPSGPAFVDTDREVMTGRDDTLWKIAARTLAADDVSVYQTILAIQRLNREAFMWDNINHLKAGYVLRLPNADEARFLSHRQAVAEVAAQNEDWLTGCCRDALLPLISDQVVSGLGSQLDAPFDSGPTAPAAAVTRKGGRTIYVDEGYGATGLSEQARASGQTEAALEEFDRLNREVDELTYQLDHQKERAKSELESKDRQLVIKEQEVAQFQVQLAEIRKQLDAVTQAQSEARNNAADRKEVWWQSTAFMSSTIGVLVLALVGGWVLVHRRPGKDEGDFYAEGVANARVERELVSELEDFDSEYDAVSSDAQASSYRGISADSPGGDLRPDFDSEVRADHGHDFDRGTVIPSVSTGTEVGFGSKVTTADEDDFGFDEDGDSVNTKLDLARAYIHMGDDDGARDILNVVIDEGTDEQQKQALSLLENL